MTFADWMKDKGLKPKSITNYSNAITGTLTSLANENGLHSGDLTDVLDPTQFDALRIQIEQLPAFQEKNSTGNYMYSNALRKYFEYLSSTSGDDDPKPWVKDVEAALQILGGMGTLEEIYQTVAKIRPKLSPNYRASIRKNLELQSSDSEAFQKKDDLFYSVSGIGSGVWGLRKALIDPPPPADIDVPEGNHEPDKLQYTTFRILRDSKLSRQLKLLHKHQCQLCGYTIELPSGARYSEGHHIKPLGGKHLGPDVPENIIVLCPNHHALLDYGVIEIDPSAITLRPGHQISPEFIEYHNSVVCKKAADSN